MVQLSYRVFVAIPFDSAMLQMYQKILRELQKNFDTFFIFSFGSKSTIPENKFLKMELFKDQNNDLLEQFYYRINASDIIIADLTNNNPNVHVELGIALTLNKNIFRVSGRDLNELGSDVKGYDTFKY